MSAHGTLTEEYFEVVKFIENNGPFSILLEKTWIEKDQARRKEEEVLEQKKQELKDFMTRRIAHLIEEQERRLFRTRNLDVEVERTQEDS
jgi:tRNA(Glu) U13 pseudouridine synthase TruD